MVQVHLQTLARKSILKERNEDGAGLTLEEGASLLKSLYPAPPFPKFPYGKPPGPLAGMHKLKSKVLSV